MESCRSQLTSRRRLHLPVLVLTQVDPELACLEHPYMWCAECTFAHGLPPPALAVHNLMEQARFAHLFSVMSGMHHRHTGYLFGSLVDFANESMGRELAFYCTRNLLDDPRCTLVVQLPGWSGLKRESPYLEWAHKRYVAKHQQWGNFYYYRMHDLSDIYFIGGFGTVAWIDVKEYETVQPDKTAVDGGDLQSLKVTNHTRSVIPCLYGIMIATGVECYISLNHFERSVGEVDAAALISVDSKGIDIRVRQGAQFNIQRLAFDVPQKVETLEESQESTPQDNNERQAANKVRKVAEAGLYAFF